MSKTLSIKDIAKELQEAAKSPSEEKPLAKALLDYLEVKENYNDAMLYQFGITPNKELVKTLSEIQGHNDWEEVVREKAERYMDEAWVQKELEHKERRKKLDDAIRLLKRLYEEKEKLQPETLTILAKVYLRRSQIIRPKGITTPAKKREAIEKGIEAIKLAGKEDAYRCRAMLYIEKERILEENERTTEAKNEISKTLEEALLNGCTRFDQLEDDIKIAVLYSELSKDNQYLNQIISSKVSNIELEKARAYRLLNQHNKVKEEIEKLIDKLNNKTKKGFVPFSAPIWDDTVRFLVQLYKDNNNDIWKHLSKELWEACKEIEENTPSTLHIRWYWSRMRNLYDLAFLATDNIRDINQRCKKRAEIVDSLKSRPAIKWNVLEELAGGNEWIKRLYEAEAGAFAKEYIVEYDELNKIFKEITKEEFKKKETLDVEDVPANWIVIHFYLNHLENKGHALIYDATSKTWGEKPFEFTDLFHAYMTWQTDYTRNKIGAAGSLEKLCKVIGKAIPFLFELSDDERPVLFIPHDFLHRLPLHGAIKTENERPKVFLEDHPSCYLPAWGLAKKRDSISFTTGKYLLEKDGDFPCESIKWDKCYKRFDEVPDNPHLLFIYCHGKADSVNPFNARLEIEEKGKTYLDIRKSDKTFNGTHLILGACETDLVPPLSDILDEHLSISTVFLDKNAVEILGTMFVVLTEDTVKMIEDISAMSNSGNLWMMDKLWKWQKTMVTNYSTNREYYELYRGVVFRIICAP